MNWLGRCLFIFATNIAFEADVGLAFCTVVTFGPAGVLLLLLLIKYVFCTKA